MNTPEVLFPLLLTGPAFAVFLKHCLPGHVAESFYEASRNGKPMAFTDNVEEIILDELTVFDECPEKDIASSRFSLIKEPISTKYRLVVADDLVGTVISTPRCLITEHCSVAIPYNILYETMDDVAKDCDRLKFTASNTAFSRVWSRLMGQRNANAAQTIEWGSELGVNLMRSLVLAQEEKRFLIQRFAQEGDLFGSPFIESIALALPLTVIGFCNGGIRKYCERKYRFQIRRPVLWPVYASMTLFGIFMTTQSRQYLRSHIDLSTDRLTAKIGEQYSRAGIDYYQKLMERHRIINGLLQKANLKSMYADDGDYLSRRYFWSKPITSLKKRLNVIKSVAEEQAAKDELGEKKS